METIISPVVSLQRLDLRSHDASSPFHGDLAASYDAPIPLSGHETLESFLAGMETKEGAWVVVADGDPVGLFALAPFEHPQLPTDGFEYFATTTLLTSKARGGYVNRALKAGVAQAATVCGFGVASVIVDLNERSVRAARRAYPDAQETLYPSMRYPGQTVHLFTVTESVRLSEEDAWVGVKNEISGWWATVDHATIPHRRALNPTNLHFTQPLTIIPSYV